MNILRRKMPAEKINENLVQRGIIIFAILLALERHRTERTGVELHLYL